MNTFEIISTSEFVEEDIALPFSICKLKRKMFFSPCSDIERLAVVTNIRILGCDNLFSIIWKRFCSVSKAEKKKKNLSIDNSIFLVFLNNAENKNNYTRPYFAIVKVRSLIHKFKYLITILYYNNKNMYQTANKCC